MISRSQYILETERLCLRLHEPLDVDFMVDLNSDPDVTRYVGGEAITREQALETVAALVLQFQERQLGRFMVIEKQTERPIGWCGLKWLSDRQVVDVGYRFIKSAWGKGYATESAAECLRYGFYELNLATIVAGADPKNCASIHVLKKLRMKEMGRRWEYGKPYIDFQITREEFVRG